MDESTEPAAHRNVAVSGRQPLLGVATLSLPVLGFWLPLLGFLVSLALVLRLVPWAGPRLWTPAGGRRRGVALLGFGAMWLPAALAFLGVLYPNDDFGSTAWLLLPLCAPEQVIAPTLTASAVYVAGAALSGVLRRPWPWVLGALLSALSYDLVIVVLSIGSVC